MGTVRRLVDRLAGPPPKSNYSWSFPWLAPAPGRRDLVLEIGSRDAVDAVALQRRFRARVVAFEPVPENIARCRATLAAEPARRRRRIDLDTRCLTDADGPVTFHAIDPDLYDNPGAGSLLELDFSNRPDDDPDRGRAPVQRRITVEGVRYDRSGLPAPHSVFMDVQGAELTVLRGFGGLLDAVRNVVLEASSVPTYRGGCDFWQLEEHLASHGLRYRASSRHGASPPPRPSTATWQGEFNAVFVR